MGPESVRREDSVTVAVTTCVENLRSNHAVSHEESFGNKKKVVHFSNDTLEKQLKHFATLRHTEPMKAKTIYETGEMLVTMASEGMYGKFRSAIESAGASEILLFHINKMFLNSLLGGYFMISNYIIECGYPFCSFSLPPALHECLSSANDDSRCKEIAEFLIEKGFDVNHQDPRDWSTPLHVAVKHQLVKTIQYLLSKGSSS